MSVICHRGRADEVFGRDTVFGLQRRGPRELALWSADEGLGDAFTDIRDLAAGCRFRDCCHRSEPGCAVLRAVEKATISAKRLESFRALQKELRFLALRQDAAARWAEQRKIAAIHRAAKKHKPR